MTGSGPTAAIEQMTKYREVCTAEGRERAKGTLQARCQQLCSLSEGRGRGKVASWP